MRVSLSFLTLSSVLAPTPLFPLGAVGLTPAWLVWADVWAQPLAGRGCFLPFSLVTVSDRGEASSQIARAVPWETAHLFLLCRIRETDCQRPLATATPWGSQQTLRRGDGVSTTCCWNLVSQEQNLPGTTCLVWKPWYHTLMRKGRSNNNYEGHTAYI